MDTELRNRIFLESFYFWLVDQFSGRRRDEIWILDSSGPLKRDHLTQDQSRRWMNGSSKPSRSSDFSYILRKLGPRGSGPKKKEKKTNAIDPMTSQVDFSRRLSERHPTWSKRRSTKPNVSLLKPADKEPNL